MPAGKQVPPEAGRNGTPERSGVSSGLKSTRMFAAYFEMLRFPGTPVASAFFTVSP
jgi:hypothetical protein